MSCCVQTCKKNKSADTLFHFPVDEKLQTMWVDILKKNHVVEPDWELTPDAQICINHFNNSCCIKTETDVLLTGEAYPTMFEVDDYLIEEIFDDENLIETTYEEIVANGDGDMSQLNDDGHGYDEIHQEEGDEEEEIIGDHELDNVEEEKRTIITQVKSVSRLKNIKTVNNNHHHIQKKEPLQEKNKQDKAGVQELDKPPMFKVVDGKLIPDDGITNKPSPSVPKSNVINSTAASSVKLGKDPTSGKSMQAIQIGNQYYLVSPNTPDGKELTASQLAAIKDKILNEINASKKGSSPNKPIKSGSSTQQGVHKTPPPSSKKVLPITSTPNIASKQAAQKIVTTIDLNKGLPSTLKNIMSAKSKKRKLVEEEPETFTVSSSLDIMPVTAKKPREQFIVRGGGAPSGDSSASRDFPGSINSVNMSSILPDVLLPEQNDEIKHLQINRTQFYRLLQDINKNMPALNKNYWSHVYDQNTVVITKSRVGTNKTPKQFLAIQIDAKLQTSIYKHDCLLTRSELSDLNINIDNEIKQWAQVNAIIDKLNLIKPTDEQSLEFGITNPNFYKNYVNRTVAVCRQIGQFGRLGIQEHDQKIITFLCEQMTLLSESREFRNYTVALLVYCYTLYLSSPSVYQYLRRVLILPDEQLLKELGSVDINKDYVHVNDERMTSLSNKWSGFSLKEKVAVLHMFSMKLSNVQNVCNVLVFVLSCVSRTHEELVYFCPTQDTIPISKLVLIVSEIIKKLEAVGVRVAAFSAEYNAISFEVHKRLGCKHTKVPFAPHPADKSRKLFLLYENVSILTAVCWEWMSKECVVFPSLMAVIRGDLNMNRAPGRASFQSVANYLQKQKLNSFFPGLNIKTINLIGQVINKENVYVDETQKTLFALAMFDSDLVKIFETSPNRDCKQTGDFMRLISDWWRIVTAKRNKASNSVDKMCISEKNREPYVRLGNINKWLTHWRDEDRKYSKLSSGVYHVLCENTIAYRLLSDSLIKDYKLDQVWLGTFQVNIGQDTVYASSLPTQHFKFPYK